MSPNNGKPQARRERRIIERPRLIKLLDETDARIILLLAPAGYGKTTLARQWAKTLNRCIWITCTPAHRDVAAPAEDLARKLTHLQQPMRSGLCVSKCVPRRTDSDPGVELPGTWGNRCEARVDLDSRG